MNPIELLKREGSNTNSNIISIDELKVLSFKSVSFTKSLKQLRLNDIDIKDVVYDLNKYQQHLSNSSILDKFHPFCIKTRSSILLKYNNHLEDNDNFLSCFNDLLGFRVIVKSYDIKDFSSDYRIVDLSKGKLIDDGYRAVHLYYKCSNNHYPIEIQLWLESDYKFNLWLHKYIYKYYNPSYGVLLHQMYLQGLILTEDDFRIKLKELLL